MSNPKAQALDKLAGEGWEPVTNGGGRHGTFVRHPIGGLLPVGNTNAPRAIPNLLAQAKRQVRQGEGVAAQFFEHLCERYGVPDDDERDTGIISLRREAAEWQQLYGNGAESRLKPASISTGVMALYGAKAPPERRRIIAIEDHGRDGAKYRLRGKYFIAPELVVSESVNGGDPTQETTETTPEATQGPTVAPPPLKLVPTAPPTLPVELPAQAVSPASLPPEVRDMVQNLAAMFYPSLADERRLMIETLQAVRPVVASAAKLLPELDSALELLGVTQPA